MSYRDRSSYIRILNHKYVIIIIYYVNFRNNVRHLGSGGGGGGEGSKGVVGAAFALAWDEKLPDVVDAIRCAAAAGEMGPAVLL